MGQRCSSVVEQVLIMSTWALDFQIGDWKILWAPSVHHNGTINVLLDAFKTINNAKQANIRLVASHVPKSSSFSSCGGDIWPYWKHWWSQLWEDCRELHRLVRVWTMKSPGFDTNLTNLGKWQTNLLPSLVSLHWQLASSTQEREPS